MLDESNSRDFERIPTGRYCGTIIDIVDLGKKTNIFGVEKARVRIVWVLNANDSKGVPFRAIREVNALVTARPRKSNLCEICERVFGVAPSLPFEIETLMGHSNELMIKLEKDPRTGKEYSNVMDIRPLPAKVVPPQPPRGFMRAKDRPAKTKALTGGPDENSDGAEAALLVRPC